MSRPLLLDLFCGAGGAAMGYHRAGFDVIGVDVKPQPNYPFEFHRGDALEALATFDLSRFRAIHASPPCQDHSTVSGRGRKMRGLHGTGWMLEAVISQLVKSGLPFVVENVDTAPMPPGVYRIRLCGSSFDLDVRRHRKFASSVLILTQPCQHHRQKPRFRSLDSRQKTLATVIGVHGHVNYTGEFELRCKAMGIDWMTNAELSQAIPPAYTAYIGAALLDHVSAELAR